MARYVFVVSRQHPDLHDYLLRERFAHDRNVVVILDRRIGERRRATMSVEHERRQADRRSRPEVDEELRSRSHAIITIP
jgi:hypothetical protein